MQHTAWKTEGARRLEKVLGNFDGRGWLGKVLARLHARLPGGLGWDWSLEKGVWGGWKRCLEILMGGGGWERCLRVCMRGCWVGWAGIGAWKLPWVEVVPMTPCETMLYCMLLYWPHSSALVAYNGGTNVGHGPVRTLFLEPDFVPSASTLDVGHGPVRTLFLGLILCLVLMTPCGTM